MQLENGQIQLKNHIQICNSQKLLLKKEDFDYLRNKFQNDSLKYEISIENFQKYIIDFYQNYISGFY